LQEQGKTIGHNRIARIMRENCIVGKPEPKWTVTTKSVHDLPVAPHLLQRNFIVDAPNQVWVGDISYVWTYRDWAYLATVIGLYGGRVVGWALDNHTRTDLLC
jgi:putative transposase